MQFQPFSITGVLTTSLANILYPGGPISAMTRPAVGWQPLNEIALIVNHVRLLNSHSSVVTVNMGLTAVAGTPDALNAIFFPLAYSTTAGTPYDWYGEVVLTGGNANHYIRALASVTNVVAYEIDGEVGLL